MKTKLCQCGCGKELTKPFQKYFSYQCMYKAEGFKVKKIKPYIKKVTNKRKKSSLNALLDTLWSKAVKILDGDKCLHCGVTDGLNSHHVIGRRNFSTRWEVKNGVTLCSKCHVFSSKFSAHQTPLSFDRFITNLKGEEWYNELEKQANGIKPDKEKLLIELKMIIYGKSKKLPF
jgi:5-methylcytosine-specific restriction endonuclease McrA